MFIKAILLGTMKEKYRFLEQAGIKLTTFSARIKIDPRPFLSTLTVMDTEITIQFWDMGPDLSYAFVETISKGAGIIFIFF